MSDGTYRGRWIDEVFRTPSVSAEVKVFLLFLDNRGYVSDGGQISTPRDELASAFGCHPRKVAAKFAAAISGGILRQITRGQKHQTAVYQAVVPGAPELSQGAVTWHPETAQGASTRHPETDSQGDKNRHPETAQGASTRHPETDSQGAVTWHPEDAQGAVTRHPETNGIDKDRARGRTHAHFTADGSDTPADVTDHDDAVVVSLFDEKTTTEKTHTPARKRATEPEPSEAAFAAFWSAYPRKVAKGAARKAWAKAIKDGANPADIVLGARRYATDPRRSDNDIRYTAHPATWLNAERWADEDAPPPTGQSLAPIDRRQQATNDLFERALERARHLDALEAQEAHGEP